MGRRCTIKLHAWALLIILAFAGCTFQSSAELTGEATVVFSLPYPSAASETIRHVPSPPSRLATAHEPSSVTDQWLISFAPSADEQKRLEILFSLPCKVIEELPYINGYLVSSSEDLQSLVLPFDDVRYVEPNTVIYAHFPTWEPDDPYYHEDQWNLRQIRMPQAWTAGPAERPVRVAVLDSGINASHPDLAGVIDEKHAYSFIDSHSPLIDTYGHGTYVAGIIGAVGNNSIGITGVMGEHITLLPVKVLGNDGKGSSDALAKGILYAAGLLSDPYNPYPAEVINLSLAYEPGGYSITVKEALNAALDAGVIITAASGNYDPHEKKKGSQEVRFPASHPRVIAVGASQETAERAYYSCFGYELELLAPVGEGVISTSHDDSYYYPRMGTSMAAPQAAGVIALMLASGIDGSNIPKLLKNTAMPLGSSLSDPTYGHGMINAHLAVYQADTIRILAGRIEHDTITAAAETTIGIREKHFTLKRIPPGDHQIFAWIDVRRNNIIEPGDYFAQIPLVHINGSMEGIILELREMQ